MLGTKNSLQNCIERECLDNFFCGADAENPCIPKSDQCDVTEDCSNGKDEENCEECEDGMELCEGIGSRKNSST